MSHKSHHCHQLTWLYYTGPRSSTLNQNVLTKLKAVYTLVEKLYTGSQRALAVVALSNEVPTHLVDVLRRLAVLPQRFQELRRASARAGAIAALSRAKAFLPELDSAEELSNQIGKLFSDSTCSTRNFSISKCIETLGSKKSGMLYFQDWISYSNEPRNRKKVGFLTTGLANEKFG